MNGTKTPNSRQEQDSAYNPGDLHAAERFPESYASHGADQAEAFANDPTNASANAEQDPGKNIGDTKAQEEAGSPWQNNYRGDSQGGKQGFKGTLKGLKKKGPAGLIIGLLIGGGGFVGFFTAAGPLALIHLKEKLLNSFDTISSATEARSYIGLKKRMFAPNKTCKIKVRCRYTGMTNRQMERLRVQGADLLDKDGKPVKPNKLGRYTGGHTLVMPDGERVGANQYLERVRSSSDLRGLSRNVFAPRWMSWNDDISRKIRAKNRLVTNPDWGDEEDKDNDKATRQKVYKAVSGQGATGVTTTDDNRYQRDADGNIIENEDGTQKEVAGADIDFGDATEDITAATEELTEKAQEGELISEIPNDPAGAASMAEFESSTGTSAKEGFGKVLGFLNPLGMVTGLCVTYQLVNAIVLATLVYETVTNMRYASLYLSLAGKLMAGDVKMHEVANAMKILQREDRLGDNFGGSATYQYIQYGKKSSKPITSTARGNSVIQLMATSVRWVDENLGGGKNVKSVCGVLTNPIVQGALALTSFIPGAGQATKVVTGVLSRAAKAQAERVIKDKITDAIKKNMTREQLKRATRAANKELLKMAGSAAGLFVAGHILSRYGVPYVARLLSNTQLTGSESGVKALDSIGNGFDGTNSITAQAKGLGPLTEKAATAYMQFNNKLTERYVADMRAKSSPFDLRDPYSASNAFAASYFTFASSINVFGQNSFNLLAAPSAILSGFNISHLFMPTASANSVNDHCSTPYLDEQGLSTNLYCRPTTGFSDPAMLRTKDPEEIIDWMLSHNQIDDEGNAVSESDYEEFLTKCVENVSDKRITDLGDETMRLDEMCYGEDDENTTQRKMFRLYTLDTGVVAAMDKKPEDNNVPDGKWVNPSGGKSYTVTNRYGDGHTGADIVFNGDFVAACSGTIKSVGRHGDHSGLGQRPTNIITIDCGNGIETQYMHYWTRDLEPSTVAGREVNAGDVLAKVGNQGNSSGKHLHFQVNKNGSDIDPFKFMKEKGVDL